MNALALPQAGEPAVFTAADGRVVTNSRDVATFFGKRHDHVLRDIDALTVQAPACLPNFGEGSYTLPSTGAQQHRCFDMTRDGFVLLAMGFTGAKALALKLAYIERFNAMEAALLSQQPARIEVDVDFAKEIEDGLRKSSGQMIGWLRKNLETPIMDRLCQLERSLREQSAASEKRLLDYAAEARASSHKQAKTIHRLLGARSEPAHQPLVRSDYCDLSDVYSLTGLSGPIPQRGLLSQQVKSALERHCRQSQHLVRSITAGGREVLLFPLDDVATWLDAEGRSVIERHITRCNQTKGHTA